MINKYLNHTKWIINAIKEHNKILKQEIEDRLKNNSFFLNGNFKNFSFYYSNSIKIVLNIDEALSKLIKEGMINRYSIINIYNVYFKRLCVTFEESIRFLKLSKKELFNLTTLFDLIFYEMKQIAELIKMLQTNFYKMQSI